jgi:hypothetical protein
MDDHVPVLIPGKFRGDKAIIAFTLVVLTNDDDFVVKVATLTRRDLSKGKPGLP